MIEWVNVKSDAILKIGYDADIAQMYIDFDDNESFYTFCRVPESLFNAFVAAESAGQYYHKHIKDRYDC